MRQNSAPLGLTFALLTRQYISILSKRLTDLPIERYFYPFWLIAESSGKIGQQQLAELLNADKVTVVRMIDYLEKEGLVNRRTNPDDRRCHLLHVTEKGKPFVEKIERAIVETDKLFLSFVKDSNVDTFVNEIENLGNKLKEIPGDRIALHYDKIAEKNETDA